jgi:hypothetical protein
MNELATQSDYPLRLEGTLEPPLSRWLWLLKWLLAISHVIVLVVLWLAFIVLSVVACFAILVTGNYRRSVFDFNVGVLRWTWRVGFTLAAHWGPTAIRRSRSPTCPFPGPD